MQLVRARVFAMCLPALAVACGAAESANEAELLPSADLQGAEVSASTGGDGVQTQSTDAPRAEEAVAPVVLGCPSDRWCSSLYPPAWTPDAPADEEGRFLHDFSYAGYRAGEAPPDAPPGAIHDVTTFGADASGTSDATVAITRAIAAAAAAGGGVVFFPAGSYRVDGVLTVAASGVVLRGAGTDSVLRFTKGSGMGNKAHLTFAGSVARDAARPLVADAAARAREVSVADASGLQAGDDVAVGWTISAAWVADHGMTGTWTEFAGQYKPFFRSKVVSVDTTASPNRVVLDVPLRYAAKLRDGAAIQKETGYLREVGLEHLAVANATTWANAWAENHSNVIAMRGVADAWIDDVHSTVAPSAGRMNASDTRPYHLASSGVMIEDAKRVSVLRSSMQNPQNRGSGGNGYLFEVSRTNDVLFADDVAENGRHNFIQNWGFGNVGTVFLRCTSRGSELLSLIGGKLVPEAGASEHHHSLAIATLVDDSLFDDGFKVENRGAWSSGAGHTGTESVVWRPRGTGTIVSKQFGWGYVIGTQEGVEVDAEVESRYGVGTAPRDFVEGRGLGKDLHPASLYEDQRARRTKAQP